MRVAYKRATNWPTLDLFVSDADDSRSDKFRRAAAEGLEAGAGNEGSSTINAAQQ